MFRGEGGRGGWQGRVAGEGGRKRWQWCWRGGHSPPLKLNYNVIFNTIPENFINLRTTGLTVQLFFIVSITRNNKVKATIIIFRGNGRSHDLNLKEHSTFVIQFITL